MKNGAVLGISTSGPVEAALVGGGGSAIATTREQALAGLLGCVQRVLTQAGTSLEDVGLIAVCTGPGSFTGLRIGVAFAKSLAQARGIPLIGVSAYDVAEAGDTASYPRMALVSGKKGYYYGRLRRRADDNGAFVRGDARAIADAIRAAGLGGALTLFGEIPPALDAPHVVGLSFEDRAAGDRARALAELGRSAHDAGDAADWRHVAIDYGQPPYVP